MNAIKVVFYCLFAQEKLEIMLINTQVPRDTKAMVAKVFFILLTMITFLEINMRLISLNTKFCHRYL